jgi:hypothetical protein
MGFECCSTGVNIHIAYRINFPEIYVQLFSFSYRIMWAGVEPEPQQYNITYLNVMKQIVESLELNKIYVIFDMHQDVLSSRVGPYDGIPLWLYDKFPPANHPCK